MIVSLVYPFFYDDESMENKNKWDKEYATSFLNEVMYLKSKRIRYTWVFTNDDGVSVWKFKKTKSLWDALSEMYSDKKYEV